MLRTYFSVSVLFFLYISSTKQIEDLMFDMYYNHA